MATDISAPGSVVLPTVPVSTYTTAMSASINDLVIADHNKVRSLYEAFSLPSLPIEQKYLAAWQLISEFSQGGDGAVPSPQVSTRSSCHNAHCT